MSKVAVDGGVADALPLAEPTITRGGPGFRMVIPGSSVKGVLRSHAERIARTVTGQTVPPGFLEQMKAIGLPGVGDLFGLAGDDSDTENRGRRGVLTINEVATTQPVKAKLWRSVCTAAAEPTAEDPATSENKSAQEMTKLANAVDTFNQNHPGLWLDVVMRNSIDRWTGGTALHRLFSTVETHADWDPIVVDIDLGRLRRINGNSPERIDAALALVLFVLIDASDGWLAIGYATTRGLGSFDVDRAAITFTGTVTVSDDDHAANLIKHGNLAEVLSDAALLEDIGQQWQKVLKVGAIEPTADDLTGAGL